MISMNRPKMEFRPYEFLLQAKMDASEGDSGKWTDMWCLLVTFPELFLLEVAY